MHPTAFAAHAPEFLEHPSPYVEHQPLVPKRFRGPIIEELQSDDEKEEAGKEKKENPRKHGRSSNGPFIQDPDDGVEERRSRHLQYRNYHSQYNVAQQQPQTHSFTFSSSTVTFGGADGAYYTSSKTRRTGSDGGRSVTRKLNSDGKVDTMQALPNINEDERSGFEEAWNRKARKHLPGWTGNFSGHNNVGASNFGQNGLANQGGWALPSTEQPENMGRVMLDRCSILEEEKLIRCRR